MVYFFFLTTFFLATHLLFVLCVTADTRRWLFGAEEKKDEDETDDENFTNKKDTQESEEPCYNGTDSNLINTPLCSEQTYENTSLANSSPSNFEVLKNVNIKETNKIVTVKDGIDDYTNQPTFLPGKFN